MGVCQQTLGPSVRDGRAEQDSSKILDLVHFDVLVTLLFGKIPIGNILFLSRFQDITLSLCEFDLFYPILVFMSAF